MDYYEKAIQKIKEEVENPVFYFFSDDPEWCRENFTKVVDEKHQQRLVFIDHNKDEDSF